MMRVMRMDGWMDAARQSGPGCKAGQDPSKRHEFIAHLSTYLAKNHVLAGHGIVIW